MKLCSKSMTQKVRILHITLLLLQKMYFEIDFFLMFEVDGDPAVFTKIKNSLHILQSFFSKKDLHNFCKMIYLTNIFQKIRLVGLFMNLGIGKVMERNENGCLTLYKLIKYFAIIVFYLKQNNLTVFGQNMDSIYGKMGLPK